MHCELPCVNAIETIIDEQPRDTGNIGHNT